MVGALHPVRERCGRPPSPDDRSRIHSRYRTRRCALARAVLPHHRPRRARDQLRQADNPVVVVHKSHAYRYNCHLARCDKFTERRYVPFQFIDVRVMGFPLSQRFH